MPRRREAISAAPSLRELEEKIERWAPQEYRAERKKLYADLEAAGIAFEVLFATQNAHGFRGAELASLKWQKEYWRRREAIEKQIEDIRTNPLVWRLEDPVFREPGPPCPHGRDRLECEQIRTNLTAYQRPPLWSGAPKNMVGAAVEKKNRARKFLAENNLGDPEKLKLVDFCAPLDQPDHWKEWGQKPLSRPGRPRGLRKLVLNDVMTACKSSRRLSQARKLEIVEQVLRYCFGDDEVEDLGPRWREMKRKMKGRPEADPSAGFDD